MQALPRAGVSTCPCHRTTFGAGTEFLVDAVFFLIALSLISRSEPRKEIRSRAWTCLSIAYNITLRPSREMALKPAGRSVAMMSNFHVLAATVSTGLARPLSPILHDRTLEWRTQRETAPFFGNARVRSGCQPRRRRGDQGRSAWRTNMPTSSLRSAANTSRSRRSRRDPNTDPHTFEASPKRRQATRGGAA